MGLFDKNNRATKRKGLFSGPVGDEPAFDSLGLDRQIGNARMRIQDSGYDPGDSDTRNWFEKLTNLPQGQNAFFDALELLGRPGKAVINAIDKNADGTQSLGRSLWRGFSGKDKISGADIIRKSGNDDPLSQAVGGFSLEVLTDPLNLVPGGAFKNAARGTGRIAAGGAKGLFRAAESVSPKFANFADNTLRPAAESVKDSLGYMFNRDYKIDNTLSGGKSLFLNRAANEAENTRRFMQEESMKNIANAAKSSGGLDTGENVGRIMESTLQQTDEAGNVLERPKRLLMVDPKIRSAAEELTKSNKAIREYAEQNGINIPEMEGYMSHVWSSEERKLRNSGRISKIDQGRFGAANPNKKILNTRTKMGSVEDINEATGRKLFEPNAYFATATGQRRLIDYVQAVKFRRDVLSNPDFAVKYEEGMVMPPNAEVIDTAKYRFLKDSDDILEGVVKPDEIGGRYVVTKAAKNALDRFQKLNTDEGTKSFLKAYDTVTSTWKRLALFSAGYHVRNAAGGMFQNYIGGMNTVDLAKYTGQASAEVVNALKGKESSLYREYRMQGLGSSSLSQVEFKPFNEPEKAVEKTVKEMSKDAIGQIKTRLNPLRAFETSREAGDVIDQTNRFAMYKYAREKLKLSPEEAAAKVKETQFDYSKLSKVEQEVFARAIPFYRWMRNNIPFQIQKFIEDPRKYSNLNKLRINAQDAFGMDEDSTPEFMKGQFAIPVSKDKFLGLGLPLGDLTKLSSPLKTVTDSLSPNIKLPIELATNRNFFFNKPIEKFKGQNKQFQVPGTGAEFGIPIKTAYALEQMTGQLGRGLSSYLQKPEDKDQDTMFRMPTLGIKSLLKDYDAKSALYYEKLDELRQLQDYLKYIEQQTGVKPRTINDIKRSR